MTALPAPQTVRIAYILLAHEDRACVLATVRSLLAADPTGLVCLHYDAAAAQAEFTAIRDGLRGERRAIVLERRVTSGWGQFGLVEACLIAFDALLAHDPVPDFFHLMSVSCMPVRPIAAFKSFLASKPDMAFIECQGPTWIVGGLREERYTLFHLFNERRYRKAFYLFVQIQRLLRIARQPPLSVEPRFGAQWWTLPRSFVLALQAYLGRNPAVVPFFRKTWIPDELFFPTMVFVLTPEEQVSNHSMTFYQFTNQGKPIIFHDDQIEYVQNLNFFFARKIGPRAGSLRAALWRVAGAPTAQVPARIGCKTADYRIRMRERLTPPRPGALFFQSQQMDDLAGLVSALRRDIVVIAARQEDIPAIRGALDGCGRILAYRDGATRADIAAPRCAPPALAFLVEAGLCESDILLLDTGAPPALVHALRQAPQLCFLTEAADPTHATTCMPGAPEQAGTLIGLIESRLAASVGHGRFRRIVMASDPAPSPQEVTEAKHRRRITLASALPATGRAITDVAAPWLWNRLTRIAMNEEALHPAALRRARIPALVLANDRLPITAPFLDHHRALGVDHFLCVTTGRHIPEQAPDVSWVRPRHSGAAATLCAVNHLAHRWLPGRWVLFLMPHEFFVFPRMESRGLADLTDHLQDDRRNALHTVVIDLFGDRGAADLAERRLSERWYDPVDYVQQTGRYPALAIRGGPTAHAAARGGARQAPLLQRIALVRWQPHCRFLRFRQYARPMKLNRAHKRDDVSITGALLRHGAVDSDGRLAPAFGDALGFEDEVGRIDGPTDPPDWVDHETPEVFRTAADLERHGLMSAGRWF
jgi:hypothetical protein